MNFLTPVGGKNLPPGYFDNDNITFLEAAISSEFSKEYKNKLLLDRDSLIRVMSRVLQTRVEAVPFMNRRVIMEMMDEIRNHQLQVNTRLKWQDGYVDSQLPYDKVGNKGVDVSAIKLSNRLGKPRVGDTLRFVFM